MTSALVPARPTGAKTEVENACDEVDVLMCEAVKRIDTFFEEKNYAKTHPEILAGYIMTASSVLDNLRQDEREEHREDERAARLEGLMENLKDAAVDAIQNAEDPIKNTRPKS